MGMLYNRYYNNKKYIHGMYAIYIWFIETNFVRFTTGSCVDIYIYIARGLYMFTKIFDGM